MLLRNFDIKKDDPDYQLKIKHLLTIKPDGFKVRVSFRDDKRPTDFLRSLRAHSRPTPEPQTDNSKCKPGNRYPMTVLYGSDIGTCEALAHRLAVYASARGFDADTMSMNDAAGKLPKGQPVIVITASYNGLPPRDASRFISWVQGLRPGDLDGFQYAVFGCGHRDWPATLFKVPKAVDAMMSVGGAQRLAALGTADTATSDVFMELERWLLNHLWPSLQRASDAVEELPAAEYDIKVTINPAGAPVVRKGFVKAFVEGARVLSTGSARQKRHLHLKLPSNVSYNAGENLQILPMNSPQLVQRILSRFGLAGDTLLTITTHSGRPINLPLDELFTARDLFASHLELAHPATPGNIQVLTDAAATEETRASLRTLSLASATAETRDKRFSVLELLIRFPDIELSLSKLLVMLPQMRPRTYSISSSPGWRQGHASLTYTVEDGGVASSYLASLKAGDTVFVSLVASTPNFCLPPEPTRASTPVIMIAAGTGLALFKAFIQDRAIFTRSGVNLAPALLFFGCRGIELDDSYRNELDDFERAGVVKAFRAFSWETLTCKYVTDQLRCFQTEISELWKLGANVYVCGAKKVADAVFDVLGPMLLETDGEAEDLLAWKDTIPETRYVVEVFN